MNINNIPNDKRDAEIHLKARKVELKELLVELAEHGMVTSYIAGTIATRLEDINTLLGDTE